MDTKQAFTEVIRSRVFLALYFVMLLQTALLVVLVLAMSHSSQLQVPVHYSAFSSVQFYREQWYYLLNFAFFGLLVFGVNGFIALKLYAEKGRSMAVNFLLLTVAVLAISTVLIVALLRVTNLLQ